MDDADQLLALVRALFRDELRSSLKPALKEVLPDLLTEFSDPDDGWVSVSGAARHLDVSPKTIHRRIREGRIQCIGKGSLTRVRKRDLPRILDEGVAEIVDMEGLAAEMPRARTQCRGT